MRLAIRYYSGTGNSARAAGIVAERFKALGWAVDLREIRKGSPSAYEGIQGADLLLVAFSALGFSPSATMAAWLRSLPRADRVPNGERLARPALACALCVSGADYNGGRYLPGWGGDAPYAAGRWLRARGYRLGSVAELSYPANWAQMTNPPEGEQAAKIVALADAEAAAYADGLAAAAALGQEPEPGSASESGKPDQGIGAFLPEAESFGRRAIRPVSGLFRSFARKLLAALFIADPTCSSCGYCARVCPAAAIAMKGGYPRWSMRCDSCNRCVNLCPSASIKTSNLLLGLHLFLGVALAAAALAAPLPYGGFLRLATRLGLLVLGPILQLRLLAPLLGGLANGPRSRLLFSRSFMAGYRRYRAPGFRP